MASEKRTRLKVLIDQCLSPALAETARNQGIASAYVGHVKGLYGKKDPTIARYALKAEMTLVTNDMFDFRKHYKKVTDHAGVICLTWANHMLQSRATQLEMFEAALFFIQKNELYQEVLEIEYMADSEGTFWVARRYEWPHWPG